MFIQKYRRPLVLAMALLLLAAGLWQGGTRLADARARRAVQTALDGALAGADPSLADVRFSVPYESCLFTARDIPQSAMDDQACALVADLLGSMTFVSTPGGSMNGNVVLTLPAQDGSLRIALSDADTCTAELTSADGRTQTAAYTFSAQARDALLARGGLPTIGEMKQAINRGLQEQLNDLGDSAQTDNTLR